MAWERWKKIKIYESVELSYLDKTAAPFLIEMDSFCCLALQIRGQN